MEPSPAESFMSAPSENFSSLFDTPSPALVDIMTPPSAPGDANSPSRSSVAPEDGATGSDKKPTKKRKSWGQVLPEPKTNLPPRKRAKTEDEKEQRRVERVLRNRRAAQSSRERKRQEVEALELKNKDLEEQLEAFRKQNELLRKQLKLQEVGASVSPNSGSSLDDTLSARLFNGSLDKTLNETVNPASLSPEPSAQSPEQASAAPSDVVTQHPAAMLSDLQCQTSEAPCQMTANSRVDRASSVPPTHPLSMKTSWSNLQASSKPPSTLTTGSVPMAQFMPPMSLPLTAIQLPNSSLSAPTSRRASSLTPKTLVKLLSSSPTLARLSSDATVVAMRSACDSVKGNAEVQGVKCLEQQIAGEQVMTFKFDNGSLQVAGSFDWRLEDTRSSGKGLDGQVEMATNPNNLYGLSETINIENQQQDLIHVNVIRLEFADLAKVNVV